MSKISFFNLQLEHERKLNHCQVIFSLTRQFYSSILKSVFQLTSIKKDKMDNEKLDKGNKLQERIREISLKLDAFRDVGKITDFRTEQYPKTVIISGRGNYRANDVISKATLKTIRLIVICEIEEILKALEKEYEEL